MRAKSALLLTSIALAACSEDNRFTGDLTGPAVSSAIGTFGACSFKNAQADAKKYFGNPQAKTAGDLIRAMDKAGAGTVDANDNGFAVLGLIADTRDNGLQAGTPAQGASLTMNVLNCMDVIVSETQDIQQVLAGALDYGAYAVRAGTEGAPVIFSNVASGILPADRDYGEWIGGRALIFGANVTPEFQEEVVLTTAFRWGLAYDATTAGPDPANETAVTVAVCPAALGLPEAAPEERVGRRHGNAETVLWQVSGDKLDWFPCTESFSRAPTFTERVLALLTPRPLHASALFFGGTGGLADGFSDFTVVNAGTTLTLTWETAPSNGFVNQPIPVVLRATSAIGTPLENVRITITVAGNQGTTVTINGGSEYTLTTGQNGLAVGGIILNKPGGYTVQAVTTFSGFEAATLLSNLFNVQQ